MDRGDTVGIARAWLLTYYLAATVRNRSVAAKIDTLLVDNVDYWKHVLQTGDLDPGPDPHAIERLGEIRVPTLVVIGDADTRDLQRIADTLRAGIPQAQLVVLPGVGHIPSLERPADITRLLEEFLATLATVRQ